MAGQKMSDPFEGLKRKRLPGMHMVTACEGGAPLLDALAAFFFMMLHDKVKHECIIENVLKEQKERAQKAAQCARTPDSAGLSSVIGIMNSSSLINEEWSYLNDRDASIFYMIANTAIEQVQRWIAEGSHKPFEIPLGSLVQRPTWATERFGTPDSESRTSARQYVQQLLAEVGSTGSPS